MSFNVLRTRYICIEIKINPSNFIIPERGGTPWRSKGLDFTDKLQDDVDDDDAIWYSSSELRREDRGEEDGWMSSNNRTRRKPCFFFLLLLTRLPFVDPFTFFFSFLNDTKLWPARLRGCYFNLQCQFFSNFLDIVVYM